MYRRSLIKDYETESQLHSWFQFAKEVDHQLRCHEYVRDSSLNGPTLSDITIPWLNGTYPWSTDNGKPTGLASFLTNCGQSKIPEFSSPPLFKPNILTNSLPQTNFPLPESLKLLPSLSSPVHPTSNNSQLSEKNQSDHGMSNGAYQGDLSISTHASRSSPPNPFLWPRSSQPPKSGTQKRDHIGNDSDTFRPRPRSSSKGPATVSGLDKPIPEVVVTTSHVDNPITTTNGAVHNTLRKTRSDMKVIHRYLVQVKHDNRDIQQIPYYELDQYIQDFVLTAKKKDGHEYEPESLKAFVHSLERHLKYHDYPHSVLKGSAFTGTRAVLNQRLNELRALSRSGGSGGGHYGASPGGYKRSSEDQSEVEANTSSSVPNKRAAVARSFTPAGLVQGGLLGKDNPQAILNSLWLINRTQFNIGGTQRHRNLVWGQFQLVTDELGVKAVKFTPLFESAEVRYCRGHGGAKGCGSDASGRSSGSLQTLSCTGAAKRQPLPFNCVELFELYANLRPPEARGVSEPFYLCPEPTWEQSGNWFKTNAAGSQLLSRIPRLLGLKPAREPMLTSTTAANLEQPSKDPYDLAADTNICSREAQSTSYFSGLSDAMLGKALFAKQQMHAQQQSASSSFPSVYPPIPPNFLNLFPFVLPPGSEPLSAPLTQQSYLMPPSTYSNILAPNSTLLFPQKSGHLSQAKSMKTTFPLEQHEADDLSHTGASGCRKYEKQLPAVDQHCGSPRSQSEPYANAPSSDGSPSPTDAENLSLSDTSPRLPACSILDAVSNTQTIYCPSKSIEKLSDRRLNQKENYSPQTSTDSHSSLSRPQSTGSRHSPVLGASSECSVRTDGNVTPERSNNLEVHEHASGQSACLTPKEVLNLAHCKQEGSSCA
ncbi:hypothetical protein PHET_01820 [Paragonimus heterotremus]|uniref:ZMYM2-like/QRICH1 C-terminal domain-containing protein n=1 Tax=Paragonimus heterotremus TaxID=100268 RepID=A0A8J4SSW0_9TREM|nr:hypothetical protein PHET_01820 [Paragonimus heterotremus]